MSSLRRAIVLAPYLLVPAVASGIIAFETLKRRRRPHAIPPIRSWRDAVDNLHLGHRVADSRSCLQSAFANNQDAPANGISRAMGAVEWCRLALDGDGGLIEKHFRPATHYNSPGEMSPELLLRKLELDRKWDSALRWYSLKFCAEEDLACQHELRNELLGANSAAGRSESQRSDKLAKLLQILLYKTEYGADEKLLDQGILSALFALMGQTRRENTPISLTVLKILSNLARTSRKTAETIANSDWLVLLSSMMRNPASQEEPVIAQKVLVNCMHSMEALDYELPPHLYELHGPRDEEKPVLDVVLIHGLKGSAFRTWRQKDQKGVETTLFWPKDWLPSDVRAPIRVIAVDYSSKFLRFGKMLESVVTRSARLQRELKQAGVGERPVVFICHSMGGLLLKQLLINDEALRAKTRGALFSAVPHRGTPVASSYTHSLLRPTDDLQLLRVESEANRELHAQFMKIAKEIPAYVSVLECEQTPFLFQSKLLDMVPLESAFLGIGALYHVRENHHHTCKPEDRNAAFYRIVVNFVNDALRNPV